MKAILILLIILFGGIIALIDRGGAILYLLVLGYIAVQFYLIENVAFFKEFFNQLPGTESQRWVRLTVMPQLLLIIVFGVTKLEFDESFTKMQFVLVTGGVTFVYSLIVLLPAIIRARRNL